MPYPIKNVTRPSAIVGSANGELHKELLTPINGGRLERTAARAWLALVAAAAADGIELKPTSSLDTYRDLDHQTSVLLVRYTPTYNPIANTLEDTRTYQGKRWWKRRGVAAVASPGTSNHGWGLAVDVANTSGARLAWLLANAGRFGFSWESQKEPWHIRYVEGDAIPQAVLDFEAGTATVSTVISTHPNLRSGDSGPAVAEMQAGMNRHKCSVKSDGQFGPKAAAALIDFQYRHGLVTDGLCGPKTWAALERTGCC